MKKFMEKGFNKLGLESLGSAHPYRLRHGGASRDYQHKMRSLTEIQKRGRWKSAASVRRYEKGGRLNQLLRSLAPKVLMKLQSATKRIEKTVLGQRWSLAALSLKKFSLRFLVDPVVWARRLHRLQAGRSYSGTSAWVPTMTYWILQIDRNSKTGFEEARSLRSTLAHHVRVFHGHETCLQDLHLFDQMIDP